MRMMPKWLLLAMPMLLGSVDVHAECAEWDVSHLQFTQSNNVAVDLRLVQNGSEINGTAGQFYYTNTRPFGAYAVETYQFKGRVLNGVLLGNRLEFDVDWSRDDRRSKGVYKLHIDEFGRLTGTSYDYYKPSNRAEVRTDERLRCKPQPPRAQAGTVHAFGKNTPPKGSAAPPAASASVQPVTATIHRFGKGMPQAAVGQTAVVAADAVSRCRPGLVWREAFDGDGVCVTPERRAMVREENRQAASRRDPNGAYGPDSCISGFVWREARANDTVCVAPEERSRVREENRAAH